MRKTVMLLLLTAGVNWGAFSYTAEQWLAFGLEFENFFERYIQQGSVSNLYTGSLGLSFSNTYFHYGRNTGVFARGFFAVPVATSRGNFDNHSLRF
jgi:hypothetical protein